ncbi:tRNA pseudouridine(55) synthase TruB [Hydrogenimonas cancrithermarum]|uniref:tRNA pseudouridine synthase B n=1 Tax=Hydrogenimonas cancrithermarum TaxID=2993563 RepID=A0ABN6WW92_9BACT|nr:tRNA pseudouridine(55) synthase TruB [Hydrogenimonas cancrithermarum]BDY13371.1 tRNA pseudouridine synthase B [Hydrogenimonas cancrithermarum]
MTCPNRLFVAKKPMFVGSNTFLSRIKRRYGVKKAGFSGTLDPFACGVLIIAFGQYTKLFRFLQKSPKTYRAVLWLGAVSDTLDIEHIERIDPIAPMEEKRVENAVKAFEGTFEYIPPKYSAKRIDGRRAYDLARAGESVELATCRSRIHAISMLHYRHPFVTFEATVSEGTYIRSLGEAIAEKLGCAGALSYLERKREGKFVYDHEKPLDPLEYLQPPRNRYLGDPRDLLLGKKLQKERFEIQRPGTYTVVFDDYFSILEIDEGDRVAYLLNKVKLCSY